MSNPPPPPGFPAGAFPPPVGIPTQPAPRPAPASAAGGGGKDKGGKRRSPRKFGLLALLLAALTGVALLVVLSSTATPDNAYVLRARQNLNVALAVTAGELEAVAVPTASLEPGVVSGDSAEQVLARARGDEAGPDGADWQVIGKRPRFPVFAGQQVRPEMFTSLDGEVGVELADTERLVSVQVPAGNALGGALGVGDRVDVAVYSGDFSGLVAENVEIVAVQAGGDVLRNAQQRQAGDRELTPNELLPTDPIPGTYVLRVPADRAVPLIAADGTGRLYLVGRGATDQPTPNAAATLLEAVCSSPSSAQSPVCAGV
jgi:Flp pilus assembly protein CpaB